MSNRLEINDDNRLSHNELEGLVDGLNDHVIYLQSQLTAKEAEIAKLKAEHRGVWYKLWKEREAENATLRGELEELNNKLYKVTQDGINDCDEKWKYWAELQRLKDSRDEFAMKFAQWVCINYEFFGEDVWYKETNEYGEHTGWAKMPDLLNQFKQTI